MDNMDYESRMELERKKKSKTQLISLLFVIRWYVFLYRLEERTISV